MYGAMMRISSIGYMFDNEKDVKENAYLATIPSHNSKEAVDSAATIALIILYLRKGLTLKKVYNKLNITPTYKPFKKFNTTCIQTIDNCLYALYNSNSFSDAIKKTMMMGGDTDTNGAIVGSLAEALYGIDDKLIISAKQKIPNELTKVLDKGYSKVKKLTL